MGKRQRQMQEELKTTVLFTEMTDPASFAMLDGIADAREGRPAAPPEGAYWLAYLEGYARDPNLLPWEA